MSMAPDMRAGDEDRDRTISTLREALVDGRLTHEEFDQRMGQAQTARTYGELAVLTSDLPDAPGPAAAPPTPVPATMPEADLAPTDKHNVRNGWAAWLGVSVMVNVIYFASWMTSGGSAPSYWPIWVMGPWGAAMIIATISRRD